jgi:hypothetical protein
MNEEIIFGLILFFGIIIVFVPFALNGSMYKDDK